MISTEFAPNETWSDAWASLKIFFRPWSWKKGKYLSLVKRRLKSLFSQNEVFLFLTGRSALYQLLKALNLPAGAEVIVQAFTCEAVVLPILGNRLKPVYVDIEPKTFSMDSEDLKIKLTDKSRVLILQHTFGLTPEGREAVLEFARQNKLFVIEDLAHGFNNNNLAMKQSSNEALLLSFGRSKALSSVFGGAIVLKSGRLAEKIRLMERTADQPSNFFLLKSLLYKPLSVVVKSTYSFYLGKIIHKIIKIFNLLPSEITSKEKRGEFDSLLNRAYPNAFAYLLIQQLKKFERIQKKRARACTIYNGMSDREQPVLRYPLLIDNRDDIIKKAKAKSIYLGKWYEQPVAPKELDLSKVGYRLGSCPKAEGICQKIINLPTNITKKEAMRVISILNDVKSNK